MSDADITQIAVQTMTLAAKVAAPILLTSLLVGFLISLFQAATQIQEQTLSFVPKMIAVSIALLVTGNWVLNELVTFTQSLFDMLVSAALMAMGMMMVPPSIVSLPFKLLLFVVVDGWALITTALVHSYGSG